MAAQNNLAKRLIRALEKSGAQSSDFDLHPEIKLPLDRVLRPSAVLIGIEIYQTVPQLLLTKRSATLKNHPGQIAFPGGRADAGDRDLSHTALREAHEEVGLPHAIVDVIGALPNHETVSNYAITPIIGLIEAPFIEMPEASEVAEIFRVPLSHVLEKSNYRIESRRWRGARRQFWSAPYGPYYIWGATARILYGLAQRMENDTD